MVRISLAPGFRFHPTDDELILYYLKRKILGKKFHYELLQKSASINTLRGIFQDLEWFFFCPREKYASGVRVKRATKNGFWKATGKDRNISWNSKIVGTVKTLIFHLGHAPQGERTNWVIHEYKILDEQLAKAGVQDNYVICKLFEKKGFGPKNGAQYGAPFNEADWADDDDNNNDNVSQECVLPVVDDGSFPTVLIQNEERHSPHDLYVSRNESPLIPEEGTPSSAVVPTSRLAVDETTDDGMTHLLGLFAHENEKGLNQADLTDSGKKKLLPSEGSGLYDGLHDLDFWSLMEEDRFDFSTVHNVNDPWTSFLPKDNSNYIELDDFLLPLDCPNVDNGTHPSSLSQTSASYSHENMQQCYSDTGFAGMNQYNSFSANDLAIPRHTYEGGDALAALQMLDHPLYEGSDASYNIDLPIGPLGNAVCTPYKMMERVNYACQTARTFQFWKEYIQIFEIPSGTCMPCRTRIVIKTSHGLLIIMFSGPQCHFWIIDVLKIGDTIVWIPSRVLCKDFVILLCKCSIFLGGCIKPLVMLVDAAGSHLENPHSRFMECFDLQLLSFLLFYFLLMVAPPYISMLR